MLNKFNQLHQKAISQDYDLPLILGILNRKSSLTVPLYIQSWRTKFYKFTQALNHFLYPLAPQLLGQKDEWVGIFRKI